MGGIGESLAIRMLDNRHFSMPWSVEETPACFIVRDHDGQGLAYLYFEDEPERHSGEKLYTRGEAQQIAAKIAKVCAPTDAY